MSASAPRYSRLSTTYQVMRTMCSGPALPSASTATMLVSAWRTWPAKSSASKRSCAFQPMVPATLTMRPRAEMPLAYPLGRGHPAGCST